LNQLLTDVKVRFESENPYTIVSNNENGVVNWRSIYSNDSRKCILRMDVDGKYDVNFISIGISFNYKKTEFNIIKSFSLNEIMIDPNEVNGVLKIM